VLPTRCPSGAEGEAGRGPRRQGMTRARCAMMDMRCRLGWRLKSTTSPSRRWRSTTSPTCARVAAAVILYTFYTSMCS